MLKATLAGMLLVGASTSPLFAQDWTAVQALPSDTPVRVEELGGKDGHVEGRIQRVDDAQLILLVRGKPIVIPRALIGRIEQRRSDPVWEGMIFGALYAIAMRVAFSGEACSRSSDPYCTIAGIGVGAAIGSFIDYQVPARREIYRAPPTPVTLMRLSF
jgi:hypothetical protein